MRRVHCLPWFAHRASGPVIRQAALSPPDERRIDYAIKVIGVVHRAPLTGHALLPRQITEGSNDE